MARTVKISKDLLCLFLDDGTKVYDRKTLKLLNSKNYPENFAYYMMETANFCLGKNYFVTSVGYGAFWIYSLQDFGLVHQLDLPRNATHAFLGKFGGSDDLEESIYFLEYTMTGSVTFYQLDFAFGRTVHTIDLSQQMSDEPLTE